MWAYIIRRILATIPVMAIVALFVFSLLYLAPGDPAAVIAGDQATPADVERIRESLGLDRPYLVRFGAWAWDIARGDLGVSIFTNLPVTTMIQQRIEPTLSLMIVTLLLAVSIAIPMGVIAAWKQGTTIDRLVMAFAVLGVPGAVLWGAVMALMSLLPAVGAVIVWAPVAIYFFFTGELVKAVGLTLWGAVVIGLVDNFLRPILVGKDTRMPDYLVLVATLGGLVVFGLNGFVIGPVIAAMFLVSWDMLAKAREDQDIGEAPAAADAGQAATGAAEGEAP